MFLFPEIPCYSNIYSSELTFISNHRSRWKIRKFRVSKLNFSRWFSKISNQRKIGWKIFCQSSISRRFQEPNLEKKKFSFVLFGWANIQGLQFSKIFQSIHPTFNSFNQFHFQKYSPRRIPTRVVFEQRLKEAWKKKKRRGQQRFSKWSKKCDNRHRGWRHSPLSLGGHWCIRSLFLLLSLSLSLSEKPCQEGGGDPFRRGRGAVIDSRALPSLSASLLPDKTASGEARVGDRELLYGVHVRFYLFLSLFFFLLPFRFYQPSLPLRFLRPTFVPPFPFLQFPSASFLLLFFSPDGGRQLLLLLRSSTGRKEKGKERLS